MRQFAWKDSLNVGVEAFDADHRQFLTYLSQIEAAMRSQRWADALRLTVEFRGFVNRHDGREEAFLRLNGYPHLNAILEARGELHRQLDHLMAALKDLNPDSPPALLDLAEKTRHQLVIYLLRGDINYKSFVDTLRGDGRLKELPTT